MEKKAYTTPETEIVKVECESLLAAESDPRINDSGITCDFDNAGYGDPGEIGRAPKRDLWTSDEE